MKKLIERYIAWSEREVPFTNEDRLLPCIYAVLTLFLTVKVLFF